MSQQGRTCGNSYLACVKNAACCNNPSIQLASNNTTHSPLQYLTFSPLLITDSNHPTLLNQRNIDPHLTKATKVPIPNTLWLVSSKDRSPYGPFSPVHPIPSCSNSLSSRISLEWTRLLSLSFSLSALCSLESRIHAH